MGALYVEIPNTELSIIITMQIENFSLRYRYPQQQPSPIAKN